MIYRDDLPFYSWESIVNREGDTDDTVPLLPFQRSLILALLMTALEQPEIFFNDIDTVDPEDITDIIDDVQSRLSF